MDGDAEFDEFGGKLDAVNDPAHAEKIFFEYLSKAYAVFLAGDDNYDAMDSELIASFGGESNETCATVKAVLTV